jgi:hypothetical protein
MKLKYLILLSSLALLSYSCKENSMNINDDNLLLGSWIELNYEGERITFKRNNKLLDKSFGITFIQNGSFTEKTSGFCGTPPLSFFNIEGTFALDNNLISISNEGYTSSYIWTILALTENKLVVKTELSEQEKEHRALMELFNEISEIAFKETCIDANEWEFISYGAKACGGPQGYLPYSKNIKIQTFLEKVDNYTTAEKKYNINWSIISDCAFINPPKNVGCQNGYPVLNY